GLLAHLHDCPDQIDKMPTLTRWAFLFHIYFMRLVLMRHSVTFHFIGDGYTISVPQANFKHFVECRLLTRRLFYF
ncbi:hypothetical protein EAY64_17290, partial [Aquitalea palustris]